MCGALIIEWEFLRLRRGWEGGVANEECSKEKSGKWLTGYSCLYPLPPLFIFLFDLF